MTRRRPFSQCLATIVARLALLPALVLPALAQTHGSSWESKPGMLRLSGLILFFGGQGPMSYQLPVSGSAPDGTTPVGEVTGSACQHGLSVPLGLGLRATRVGAGLGLGGYERALADLLSRSPDVKGIYDAKVDDRIFSILGIYRKLCTEITARGYR